MTSTGRLVLLGPGGATGPALPLGGGLPGCVGPEGFHGWATGVVGDTVGTTGGASGGGSAATVVLGTVVVGGSSWSSVLARCWAM
jgi:hypothetical protein